MYILQKCLSRPEYHGDHVDNVSLLTEIMRIIFASEKHVVRVVQNIVVYILQKCISRPEYHDDYVDNLSLLTGTMRTIFSS